MMATLLIFQLLRVAMAFCLSLFTAVALCTGGLAVLALLAG